MPHIRLNGFVQLSLGVVCIFVPYEKSSDPRFEAFNLKTANYIYCWQIAVIFRHSGFLQVKISWNCLFAMSTVHWIGVDPFLYMLIITKSFWTGVDFTWLCWVQKGKSIINQPAKSYFWLCILFIQIRCILSISFRWCMYHEITIVLPYWHFTASIAPSYLMTFYFSIRNIFIPLHSTKFWSCKVF